MYTTLNAHYQKKFGCKVYKLSLDGGFTCPNRDGTVGDRGCIFCSRYGGGEFAQGQETNLTAQLAKAKEKVAFKVKSGKFIAYFQSFSNTYGHPDHLRKLYLEAIAPDDVVGLAIGTRPDCLGEEVLDVLKGINAIKPVSVELGLQTIHESTARYIRRGYSAEVYFDAVGGAIGNKYYVSMRDVAEQWHLFVFDTAKRMWHKEDNLHALSLIHI